MPMSAIPEFVAGVVRPSSREDEVFGHGDVVTWVMTDNQKLIAESDSLTCFICDDVVELEAELRRRNPCPVAGCEYAVHVLQAYAGPAVKVFSEPVVTGLPPSKLEAMIRASKGKGVLATNGAVDALGLRDQSFARDPTPFVSYGVAHGVNCVRLVEQVQAQNQRNRRRKHSVRKNKAQIDLSVIRDWICEAADAIQLWVPDRCFDYVPRQPYKGLVSELESRRRVLRALGGPLWLTRVDRCMVGDTQRAIEFMPWVLRAKDYGRDFMLGIRQAVRAAYRRKHPVGIRLMAAVRAADAEWRAKNMPKKPKRRLKNAQCKK